MSVKVRYLDLSIRDAEERGELLAAIDAVFQHGMLVMGPEVAQLETTIATYLGRQYAVGVNSGTDALFLGLKSLGVGPGDEVITTSLSWIATANAIALTGATPVFADIEDDLNISAESVEKLITSRTKAIMPVHYTGKICRMDALCEIADRHGIALVEDASQAFSARHQGRLAGVFGKIACFSMNPMKIFAACGEAGMVVTDSKELYEKLIALRYNGTVNKETCIQPSLNGRLDTLQAAILLKRFDKIGGGVAKRRQCAAYYDQGLQGVVEVPVEQTGESDVYYTYTVRAARRDELMRFLGEKGIETKIQHPLLMPQQPAYRDISRGGFPRAEQLVKTVLCLPCHEKLTSADLDYVIAAVKEFYCRG